MSSQNEGKAEKPGKGIYPSLFDRERLPPCAPHNMCPVSVPELQEKWVNMQMEGQIKFSNYQESPSSWDDKSSQTRSEVTSPCVPPERETEEEGVADRGAEHAASCASD